jgi:beta-RFAP synthase
MVDDPGLEVLVERSSHWEASGPLGGRALGIAMEVGRYLETDGHPIGPLRLTTLHTPEAHVGLGVGTQLSLAVARGLTALAGRSDVPVETLARLTGRGRRSGIGIHGFGEGGLIVDGGRRAGQDVPTRLLRYAFPPEWSVLLVVPERATGLFGLEESQAFETIPPVAGGPTDRLCGLVLLGLLPALVESDLDRFGEALTEIQEVVGGTFSSVQGGRFASPKSESLVARMKALGLTGIGQSSWGPTLYALSRDDEDSRHLIRETLRLEYRLPEDRILWTRASTTGAECVCG